MCVCMCMCPWYDTWLHIRPCHASELKQHESDREAMRAEDAAGLTSPTSITSSTYAGILSPTSAAMIPLLAGPEAFGKEVRHVHVCVARHVTDHALLSCFCCTLFDVSCPCQSMLCVLLYCAAYVLLFCLCRVCVCWCICAVLCCFCCVVCVLCFV